MENSPSCSSNSGSPAQPPTYFRLSSEVVEKPAFEGVEDGYQDFQMVPEVMEGSYPPLALPNSPSSTHSKSDSEVLSDVAQGDVDEGFDEEFEDRDINDITDADPEPNNFELSDLDPKELQHLLNDPQFDLGVDVLEQPHPILSPVPMTSYNNFTSSPCSPYQGMVTSMVTSSPCETTPSTTTLSSEMNRGVYYNDYNLGGMENPPSVQSNYSASTTSTSHTSRVDDLSLPLLQADRDAFPDSTSEVFSLLSEGEGGAVVDTTTTPELSPPPPPPYQPSPGLHPTSATTGGLDLAETGNLLDLIELSTALSAGASVDTHSMYMFGNGSGQLSLSPSSSSGQLGSSTPTSVVAGGGVSTNVITLMDSTMLSQQVENVGRPALSSTPPPRPTPTSLAYQQHTTTTTSRRSTSQSPAPSPRSPVEQELSTEDRKLVDMPYYQFRKILDDPSVPEKRKEEIKNIRRKGRNKIAAKVCRHKKLHLIMGLEQEVEQLRKAKANIALKTKALEKEIAELKRRCHTR